MARFLEAIAANPATNALRVRDSHGQDPRDWELDPMSVELLSDTQSDGLHVVKALHVLPRGATVPCYMDVNLPERISDYVFFPNVNSLRFGLRHEFPGTIIPANAIDCFGLYELFYARERPEVGIEILKRGLEIASRKHIIAEDLGYILRDEQRFREAAQMFKVAVDEGPSSYFIYGELAGAYAELGDFDNQQKYVRMFKQAEARGI